MPPAAELRGRLVLTLRSGKSGRDGKVKSRKQAIAIGRSEARVIAEVTARKKGAKVPSKGSSSRRRTGTKRKRSRARSEP